MLEWKKLNNWETDCLPSGIGGIYIYVEPWHFIDAFEVIVYVGQTNDFFRRHNNEHLGVNEQNSKLKDFLEFNLKWSIYYAKVEEIYRDGVENYIFNSFHPKFNEVSPPGDTAISCNLPKSICK